VFHAGRRSGLYGKPLDNGHYHDYKVRQVDSSSLQDLPAGIDERNYKWIDLNGEGISGVCQSKVGMVLQAQPGGGQFGSTQVIAKKPSISELARNRQQLLDIAGDGTMNLVSAQRLGARFYERSNDGAWGVFRTFRSSP